MFQDIKLNKYQSDIFEKIQKNLNSFLLDPKSDKSSAYLLVAIKEIKEIITS